MKPVQPPPGQTQSAVRAAAVQPAPPQPNGAPASSPRGIVAAPQSQPQGPQALSQAARALSDQPLCIEPIGADNNDASLSVAWHPVQLGAQRSLGCVVRAPAGRAVSVLVEQGAYRKKLSGTEFVELTAIPVAAAGTEGSLTVCDEAGAAIAQFGWVWQPPGAAQRPQVPSLKNPELRKQSAPAQHVKGTQATRTAAAGAVTTTFFSQAAQGQRFAFILDMSGSMAGPRWAACLRELTGALQALSGQAEFFVLLFSDHLQQPPGQLDWTMAHPDVVKAVIEWMGEIQPVGGTMPGPAFERVFALSTRPDALYFMTDGIFEDCTPADVARLNGSGTASKLGALMLGMGRSLFGKGRDQPATVIHTIALDEAGSAAVLKQIAKDSGGQYGYVSSG